MEQKAPQRFHSVKNIKSLDELVGNKIFNLPRSMANSIDTMTGKPCVWVGVNGVSYNIPVEEPTPISYEAFCVLKDVGILNRYSKYTEGEDFNPL